MAMDIILRGVSARAPSPPPPSGVAVVSPTKRRDFKLRNNGKMKEKQYVHNLTDIPLEQDVSRFLTLGSSFIIRPKPLTIDEIMSSVAQMKIRFVLMRHFVNDKPCPPLYAKSKINWQPNTPFRRWINQTISETQVKWMINHVRRS
jgi:hypothetical protein